MTRVGAVIGIALCLAPEPSALKVRNEAEKTGNMLRSETELDETTSRSRGAGGAFPRSPATSLECDA